VSAAGSGLVLSSSRHERPRLEKDLASGEFDLALDVLLPIADRVPHERIIVDRLVVVARKGHPALRGARRRGLGLDAYLALEHVQVSSRRRGPSPEDVALRALGLSRRVRVRCQSHAAACRIAAGTDLIATVPQAYVEQVLERASNVVTSLPLAGLSLETYMYWPENSAADAANRWLRERVRATLRT
jgi:DNA-binding transcriptional LysR family regulator